MKTKKRLLSIMLTLALVLGLMPGMSLTAFANEHTHNFEYSASGDTITATCKNEGCDLPENKVTLTIGDPTNIYWDDKSSSHEFTLVGLEAFNSATGKTISASDIVYYKGDNQSQDIKNNTVKGATYKARLTVEGVRAEHSFKFTAKPIVHTHSFTYTANGAVITATCTSTTGTCDLTNKQATLTLNAPLHTTYGDGKNANATLTGEIPGVTNPAIHYSKGSVTLSSAPTDAGTYTAWCQLGNATASVEYTIGKATNNGWTTLPQAINNLVYTGQPQDLITAGVPSAGNALYTVGTDPDNEPDDTAGGRPYTSSVPEMTNAGTYYVWCKIDGGKNYTSINAQKVEVTIARADITPSVSIVGWTYGQTANTPMVGDTDNPGNGEVTYTYKVKDADDSTYKSTVPTAAGNYTVKAAIAETANYNSGVATKDFTISKANSTVTKAPEAKTLTYNGQAQALATAGEATGGTMQYAIGTATEATGTYGTSIPAKTNVGTYYVWYKVVGDDNHNDSQPDHVTVKINPVVKTELNNAIKDAQTYYNSIKDTKDYEAIASKLKTAIDAATEVKNNDNVVASAVDSAVAAIKKAKSDAAADVKAIEDQKAAEEKEAADTAAAKEVSDKIDGLPAADKVTTGDKAAIESARQSYESLTDDQKKKVSEDTLKKLADAETALAAAQVKAVKSVTVNAKTVNAKTLKAAIAKAGGSSKYVNTIIIGKKVKKIKKGAFKNFRSANTLVVKTKKLTRARVKGSLKGSTIKNVKVKVGKKTNKKYVKKYKKIFTKKNCGKKVRVTK